MTYQSIPYENMLWERMKTQQLYKHENTLYQTLQCSTTTEDLWLKPTVAKTEVNCFEKEQRLSQLLTPDDSES